MYFSLLLFFSFLFLIRRVLKRGFSEEFLMYSILKQGIVVTVRAFCTYARLISLDDYRQ